MSYPQTRFTRRTFLKSAAAFGTISVLPSRIALGNQSSDPEVAPSEKVNLAAVGIGNRGGLNITNFFATMHCNFVAFCDVDLKGEHVQETLAAHPNVPTFVDFRAMFDKMADQIDAVLISTPDHSHFAVAMLAMSLGKHVYVEKPLANTFGQIERMIDLAQRSKVVTQMGNQGHSGPNYFQFKAWSEAGIIRDVTRITAHMNLNRRWHGWGQDVVSYPSQPLPEGIDWDQWRDVVAAEHPFSDRLHPQEWRSWFDQGTGCFGDWGAHILDTCHRFLELGLPERISVPYIDGANALVYPQASTIQFDFPERGPGLPACAVTWYDGQANIPYLEKEYSDPVTDPETGVTTHGPTALDKPGKVLYSKEMVFRGGHHDAPLQVVPREKFLDIRRSLPSFPQKNSYHYLNFLLACKGEEEARSPFSVSGPLSQVFCLGCLAQRFATDLEFDPSTKQITNHKVANELLDPAPRPSWASYYKL